MACLLLTASFVCLGWAAWLAAFSLVLLLELASGRELWTLSPFLVVLGLAATSAMLVLIGTRVLHDQDLPARLARGFSPTPETLVDKVTGGKKPKPARHHPDLD